jgi:hypothetical protein
MKINASGFFYVKTFVYIYSIIKNKELMLIYTVIPFYFDGIEIFQNDVASFQNYDDAYYFATNHLDGRRFEIIENFLK